MRPAVAVELSAARGASFPSLVKTLLAPCSSASARQLVSPRIRPAAPRLTCSPILGPFLNYIRRRAGLSSESTKWLTRSVVGFSEGRNSCFGTQAGVRYSEIESEKGYPLDNTEYNGPQISSSVPPIGGGGINGVVCCVPYKRASLDSSVNGPLRGLRKGSRGVFPT